MTNTNHSGALEWMFSVIPFVIPALVVLRVAFNTAKGIPRDDPRLLRSAKWLGLAVVSLASYLFGVLFVGLMFVKPFFSARAVSQSTVCRSNLKQLSAALLMYAQDFDETLPPARRWGDSAVDYLPDTPGEIVFRCPSSDTSYGFAFNRALDQIPLVRIGTPESMVLLLETDATNRNALGEQSSLPNPPRHYGGVNIAYANGTVKWASGNTQERLPWKAPTPTFAPRVERESRLKQGTTQVNKPCVRLALHVRRTGHGRPSQPAGRNGSASRSATYWLW